MHVYCPEHTDTFWVPQTDPVLCQTVRHYLGRLPSLQRSAEPAPLTEFWEYCCSCQTFWPSKIDGKVREKCPVCSNVRSVHYWCNSCLTLSSDSAAPSRRQVFTISQDGLPLPNCPGCYRSVAFSGLYEHECKTLQVCFSSALDICPCCGDSIGPLPSFPILAVDFLRQIGERNQQDVGFDILEIENSLLAPSPVGEFTLIPNGSNKGSPIVLPKRARFASPNDYQIVSSLYDCDNPGVGNVRIITPAIVEAVAGGWKLKDRGRLQIIDELLKANAEQDGASTYTPADSSKSDDKDVYPSVEVSPRQAIEEGARTNEVAGDPVRSSAKSFYRRLVAGGSATNNLVYLDFKKSASKDGLSNSDELLREVSSDGAFVLFVSDENKGWVFPNPKLDFNLDSLKTLFPTLTADRFDKFKEHIEPVPVIHVGKDRWRVEPPDRSQSNQSNNAVAVEPKTPQSEAAPIVFPVSAADCLAKTASSAKVVRHDVGKNALVAAPNGNGELALVHNSTISTKGGSLFVVPRITRFTSPDTFHNLYKEYYECPKPSAGEVWIIKPAVVAKVAVGWHLREKGRLEIDFVIKSPPIRDPKPKVKEIRREEVRKIEPEVVRPEPPIPRRLVEWRLRLAIGIIASLVLLAAVLVAIRRGPGPTVGNRNASPTPSPANMVRIPGGVFRMGNDAGDEYEKPAHREVVRPFLMDANEVTCEEYLIFVKAKNHRIPTNWMGGQYPAGAAKEPVTGVDWDDATAYAKWIGKRLPTEEEWEFAARGTDGRSYPWGSEWRADVANAGNTNGGQLVDVGSYPAGKGPFGTMDMIGNAWEWTASEWRGYPGGPIPPDASNQLRVIRGGYWGSSAAKATTTFRRGWDARGAEKGYQNTGFRCAADLNAQTREP